MLRPARFTDVPALASLLQQQHAKSRYAGQVGIDIAFAKRLLAQLVQRHGGSHDGGSFVAVVENGEGVICGFVAGMLDRVYLVGDKLRANDLFLVAAEGAPPTAAKALMGAYITWAEGVRDCVEISLSWSDALPGAKRMGPIYERMGFAESGRSYLRTAAHALEQAA